MIIPPDLSHFQSKISGKNNTTARFEAIAICRDWIEGIPTRTVAVYFTIIHNKALPNR